MHAADTASVMPRASTCASCHHLERCLPGSVPTDDRANAEGIVSGRQVVRQGVQLTAATDSPGCLYAIRNGFFKTSLMDEDGREQVTGFFMAGELISINSAGKGSCASTAIALEHSEICAMPYARIEQAARWLPSLQQGFHAVLAREIQRSHGVMMLLGSMDAEERVAAFLINLSMRYLRSGYSSSEFHLRMSRHEIGAYLGLSLETVSRVFTRLRKRRLIDIELRHLRIVDAPGLRRIFA